MSGTGDEPLLSLTDVEVSFEGERSGVLDFSDPAPVRAVDGVTLDIHENDVVVILGESGCGKTTLGKTAIGVQRPTGGSVKYRGQDIWDANDMLGDVDISWEEIRRSLQIVHQDPGSSLNPHRRVRSTLESPLKQWHQELDGNDRQQRILGMLEYVGMTPAESYIDRYPHQLSGGEKQRVALIRAIMMNPDVILADEAVSALDVSLRVEMMDLMIELQNRFDTSFVFISHTLSNARYIAGKTGGRIAVMYLGDIVEIGTTEQIINDPTHPYTKALRWATPNLNPDADPGERPIESIDIPDPTNPPSGCKYHTRCPEAREVCQIEEPDQVIATSRGNEDRNTAPACFRAYEDHEYWNSPPLHQDEGEIDSSAP